MRVNYELNFRDFALFQAIHHFLSAPLQIFYLGWAIFISLSAMVGESSSAKVLTAFYVYLVIWAVALPIQVVFLALGKYRALLTGHAVEILDDGICDQTGFSKSSHFWAGINRVVRRWGFIAIYIHDQNAFIIPNRAFDTADQRRQFFCELKQRFANAR